MPITPTSTSAYDPTQQTTTMVTGSSSATSSLDKNGFLKMLTAQLANQDPLGSGQDPSQTFQTISQMTMVEQLTNLAVASERQSATALVGKTVTYAGRDGQSVTGTVNSVQIQGSKTSLTVDGLGGVDPATLKEVQ